MGVWSGLWSATTASGIRYENGYEEDLPEGPWTAVWPDGYSEIGSRHKGQRHGTWTVTWPDGVEALVPYVEGRIHGEVTVTRDGTDLGTLVYWKGERVGPGLPPVLLADPDE